jgi:RNA polymerase sigma-70 factor (ECF subfamily)
MRAALPQTSPSEPSRASDVVAAIPLETCEDAIVVERLLAGDQRAEAELYRRYAPLLARAVERLLRSSQDAQDVLQDTFVIALEEIRRLRDPSAIRGWLLQIAVRQVHRRFRRRRLRRLLGFEDPEPDARLDQLAAAGTPPEVVAELALLDRALARVNAHERMAWMLRRVEGYALDEVAQSCGCSLATAKRRITTVDAVVAGHMEVEGEGDGET